MKLLGHANSINVRKVLWTCAEIGIELDREDWGGLTRSTKSPEFTEVNPKQLVPVLIDKDFVLTESNAICRYLAASSERTDILPQAPQQRAMVEEWMDWQATELNTAWRAAFMGLVRRSPDYADHKIQDDSIHAWNSAMSILDQHLDQSGPFVCGVEFTLADIVLALSTNRWESTPMTRPHLSAVAAWMDRLSDRQGFVSFCRNGVA